MANGKTGWERERRVHFDEIVVNYHRTRPEYPPALFRDIFAYAGAGGGKRALELGAGTGKATAPFLEAGYDVTAVELGGNMADFLRERFREHRGFRVINAAFEDVPVEEGSYDLVYAASSIHWMDADAACPKVFRALRRGGVFALLRYDLAPAYGDALYDGIRQVYERHYYSHYTTAARPVKKSREDYLQPAQIGYSYGFEALEDYGFRDVSMKFYDEALAFDGDGYVAFLDTMADIRGLPEQNRSALYGGIREVIAAHGGRYSEGHVFRLYSGRKPW